MDLFGWIRNQHLLSGITINKNLVLKEANQIQYFPCYYGVGNKPVGSYISPKVRGEKCSNV